jgi:hypothetical protein
LAVATAEVFKEASPMNSQNVFRTLLGILLLGAMTTSSIGAVANLNRTTHVTFSHAVRLPGVALPPGTYVFEIVNPEDSADLVRVSAGDRSKVYVLQFTQATYRPVSRDLKPAVVLGEQPAGTPPTVQAWFPEDELVGRQFIY